MEKQANLMMKGFNELQEVISRKPQNSVWNPPTSDKISPSKASRVIEQYYKKQPAEQSTTPFLEGYKSEVQNLQKWFLTRPGCPRYSHVATSTSATAEGGFPRLTRLPSDLSTMTLTSQMSLDDWNTLFPLVEALDSGNKIYPTGVTQSLAGLCKWKSFTDVSATQSKIHFAPRIPWYITVLQEKDQHLQKLGTELSRLSKCEAECTRKDEVISVLRDEVGNIQKQLEQFQKGGIIIEEEPVKAKEVVKEKAKEEQVTERQARRGWSLPINLEQKSIPDEFRQEIERLKLELAQSDKTLGSKMGILSESLLRNQEELEELEKEYAKMQQDELESREEVLCSIGSRGIWEREGPEEVEMALRKFQESQRVNEELYHELEKVKNDYDVATGAISSLQRQLSFEESQLRKAHAEGEQLQKALKEREDQLEAMSTKFCNLREERKQEEMMGAIERENNSLRQVVSELESQLAEKTQMMEDMQGDVNRLQAQLIVNQHHTSKQLTQEKGLQRQLDVLQRAEQQTRVLLEAVGIRFERFRTKIIQATFSIPGTKSPQAEITDDEVLEALQRIINDRMEFNQIQRQKGVKGPSLSSESSGASQPPKKKAANK